MNSTTTNNNTFNPFALLFPALTQQQQLAKQLNKINNQIEAEELRLISLQHRRSGILAQLDHLGVCSSTNEDNKQYWPELT